MSRRLRSLAVLPLLALAGCGSGGEDSPSNDADAVVVDGGVSHIHGVGINPADDAVVVATHSGLFRAAPGQQRAERARRVERTDNPEERA